MRINKIGFQQKFSAVRTSVTRDDSARKNSISFTSKTYEDELFDQFKNLEATERQISMVQRLLPDKDIERLGAEVYEATLRDYNFGFLGVWHHRYILSRTRKSDETKSQDYLTATCREVIENTLYEVHPSFKKQEKEGFSVSDKTTEKVAKILRESVSWREIQAKTYWEFYLNEQSRKDTIDRVLRILPSELPPEKVNVLKTAQFYAFESLMSDAEKINLNIYTKS